MDKQLDHMRDCPLCNAVPDDPYNICPVYTQMENEKSKGEFLS